MTPVSASTPPSVSRSIDQRVVDLASTRVKNYQYSSAYHFLPAQAWLR